MTRPFASIALTLGLITALPAAALAARIEEKAIFDVSIGGIGAAYVSYAAVQDGNRYSVSGVANSAGLATFFRRFSYSAKAKGTVSGKRYTPVSYSEKSDTEQKKSTSEMTYSRGVPNAVQYNPPREGRDRDVDPATQGGTVDTLTALYAVLRDVDKGQECNITMPMYDGRYASRISLGKPERKGDKVSCSGEYRRIAGFSQKKMAKRSRFPFTLTYQPGPDGRMQVREVIMQSTYGVAVMKRR